MVLGEVDISTYSMILRQTLPKISNAAITKNIFINENLYFVAINDISFNTF
jgi:hypothetical protein